MSLYIDSANIQDIKEALSLGYVSGVTTNPLLMAKTDGNWLSTLEEICSLTDGPVYYQIDETKEENFAGAARAIYNISPKQIILKIPATPPYFKLAKEVGSEIPCCVTAVYTDAQLFAAAEAGAEQVAVYVNRISRFFKEERGGLSGDGPAVVKSMRELIDKQNLPIKILAASLKSPQEAVLAAKAGAHFLTTTLDVLKGMSENELSEEATDEFGKAIENR